MARTPTEQRERKTLQFWPPQRQPKYRVRMRPNQPGHKFPLRLLIRTQKWPSLCRPRSLLQPLPCFRVMDVPVLRCGMDLGFSLRTVPITRNWAGSSNPPCGSIRPIPPIGEQQHPALWAIIFRSPSPSHWHRWPWSQIRNIPSSPDFYPTGAKHSISPKDTVVAREDKYAAYRVDSATGFIPCDDRLESLTVWRSC